MDVVDTGETPHLRHSWKASAGDDRVATMPAKPEGRREGAQGAGGQA